MDSTASIAGRILVVDDHRPQRRLVRRALSRVGHEVTEACSGAEALALLTSEHFDTVITDIQMPEMDGLTLIRHMRSHAMAIPVILMTGEATVDSAVEAIDLGVVKYLRKPFEPDELREAARNAVPMARLAALQEVEHRRAMRPYYDEHALGETFAKGMSQIWIAYQPIVNPTARLVHAYEALLRSHHPDLRSALTFLDTAEKLDRLPELGRRIRELAPTPILAGETGADLFINLHPSDLADEQLYAENSALARIAPRVVLEVTERASLDDVAQVEKRVARLRELGYRIAVDDLGAGYSGLTALAMLEPDIVKLDMSLIQGIETSITRRNIVSRMIPVARDLGAQIVAEGIETRAQCEVLIELGCDLLQGYYFAQPGPAFPEVNFDALI
jgi:EAL domain-containing protein (putative c-di-GMP-specific phosphodiesterase class I)